MTSEHNGPVAGDSHAHEAFDPEPIRTLPADEPRTPLWLPALGVALFAVAGLVLATRGDETGQGAKPASSASAAADADLPPPPPGGAQPERPTGRVAPPGSTVNADIQKVRQRLLEARRAGAMPGQRPDGVRPPPAGDVPRRPTQPADQAAPAPIPPRPAVPPRPAAPPGPPAPPAGATP